MNDTLQYTLMRICWAVDAVTVMNLSGLAKVEFLTRHYHTTIHALAALGMANEDIDNVLREAERRWESASADHDGNVEWPYPSRLGREVSDQ